MKHIQDYKHLEMWKFRLFEQPWFKAFYAKLSIEITNVSTEEYYFSQDLLFHPVLARHSAQLKLFNTLFYCHTMTVCVIYSTCHLHSAVYGITDFFKRLP